MATRYGKSRAAFLPVIAMFLANGCSAPLPAAEPASQAVRARPLEVSVAVHFGIGGEYNYEPEATSEAMEDLGIAHYRDDLPWVEFMPGGDGAPAAIPAKLVAFDRATAAHPLYILGHRHPEIAGGGLPTDRASADAFARYVTRAVDATRAPSVAYEIWNEWNMTPVEGRGPLVGPGQADDPRAAIRYAAIARAGVAAAKRADPQARVLVGAVGTDPDWSWTSAVVGAGGAEGADGMSVHVYNHCEAEAMRTGDGAIAQLEALRSVARRDGWAQVPIWVTEAGWPTPSEGPCGVSPDRAADNLAQMLLWSAATPWIAGLTIYQLKDQGLDTLDIEDNFGLYDYYYEPKPAACTVREAVALLGPDQRWSIRRPRPDLTVLGVDGAKGSRAIAWSTAPATLAFGDRSVAWRALCGSGGRARSVPIGTRPVVIDLADLAGDLAGMRVQ